MNQTTPAFYFLRGRLMLAVVAAVILLMHTGGAHAQDLAFDAQQADLQIHNSGIPANTVLATLPAAGGGTAPYIYSAAGLPVWLAFDAGTRQISNTADPQQTITAPSITYTVTDSANPSATLSQTFAVEVKAAPTISGVEGITYAVRAAIATTMLPAASGGFPPYRYELRGELPPGLVYTAATREISGTPTRAGEVTVTYAATDTVGGSSGTAQAPFTITIMAALPGIPQNFAIVAGGEGDEQARFRVDEPADTGAADITGYRIRWTEGAGSIAAESWVDPPGAQGVLVAAVAAADGDTSGTYTVTGLRNGVVHEFQIAAENSAGTGDWAPATTSTGTVSATPFGFPAAITDLTADNGDRSLTLSWTSPADTGGFAVTAFRYRWSNDGDDSDWESAGGDAGVAITDAAAITHAIQNLTNGTDYQVQIAAANQFGVGEWSASVAGMPFRLPTRPLSFRADAANEGVLLAWTKPIDAGGAPVLTYFYRWTSVLDDDDWENAGGEDGDEIPGGGGVNRYLATGLENGITYHFQLAAATKHGLGTWTQTRQATPQDVPSEPLRLAAFPGDAEITLTWSPPASTSPSVTSYLYRYSNDNDPSGFNNPGGESGDLVAGGDSARSVVIGGLTNGSSYYLQVAAATTFAATETSGAGLWSPPVTTIPSGELAPPFNISVNPGDMQVTVTYHPPSNISGLPTVRIRYRWSNDGDISTWENTGGADGVIIPNSAPVPIGSIDPVDHTITGLVNGVAYQLQLAAENANEIGLWSVNETQIFTPSGFSLDVDGNGDTTAADGIMIARFLLGIESGSELTAGQTGADHADVADAIQAGVDQNKFNVDDMLNEFGEQTQDAQDGILIARFLAGLRGVALVKNFPGVANGTVARNIRALPRPDGSEE